MKKCLPWVFLILGFLIFPWAFAASVFNITTNNQQVIVSVGGTASIVYTIQNISGVDMPQMRYFPPAGTQITSTTCGATLANQATCAIALAFQAPRTLGTVSLEPMKACGRDGRSGQVCSQSNSANGVKIIVTPTTQFYTVTPSAEAGGSIVPNTPQVVAAGSSVSFIAIPEATSAVGAWFVDGVLAQTGGTTFTLTNIQANHTVMVVFVLGGFSITVLSPSSSLQYQALLVSNESASAPEISSVTIAPVPFTNRVKWCQAGDSSCFHQSTCPALNTPIPPGTTCELWFQSLDGSEIPVGPDSGSITVEASDGSHMFTADYEMDLYVGGRFMTASDVPETNGIARWDGSSWASVGGGVTGSTSMSPGRVFALAVYHGDLYVGGSFTAAGNAPSSGQFARWDGSNWSGFGHPFVPANVTISTLLVDNGNLYPGGAFTSIGGVSANDIAQWDGTTWAPLGTGPGDTVRASIVYNGDLYAGLDTSVQIWDGSTWVQQAATVFQNLAFGIYNGDLYSARNGNGVTPNIFQLDGFSSVPIGTANGTLFALSAYNSELYTMGFLTAVDGVPVSRIARWNGTSWAGVGTTGLTGGTLANAAAAFAVAGGDLYVGFTFTMADTTPANNIVQWDGTSWTALGAGVSGPASATVYAIQPASSLVLH